jgi:hypothetical protein
LISVPILGYANFELPFEIHTDASGTALGAVLYQEQSGLIGFGQFTTFSVLAGSNSTPASDTTWPTYFTLRVKNEHF